MARPARNGIRDYSQLTMSRQTRGNHRDKTFKIELSGKTVGRAPSDFTDAQRAIWNRYCRELPYLDYSHRAWLSELVRTTARYETIQRQFEEREAALVEAGRNPAEAYLSDCGQKRHPLHIDLLALSESMRKSLAALGGSPKAQVGMVSQMAEASTGGASRFLPS